MFVPSNNGSINVDHIVRYKTFSDSPRNGWTTIYYYGADDVMLGEYAIGSNSPRWTSLWQSLTETVMSAPAGAHVVLVDTPNAGKQPTIDDVWVRSAPVIAWRISDEGATPVLPPAIYSDPQFVLMRGEDGSLYGLNDAVWFDSLDEAKSVALQQATEAWQRRQTQRAAE